MVNPPIVLQSFLAAQGTLTALAGTRIWEERVTPIKGYTLSDGPAICFRSRGGTGFDYSDSIYHNSWMVKCYGEDEAAANDLYYTLVAVLHGAKTGVILSANLEIAGQTLHEPAPLGWPYSLSFFETQMFA